MSIRYGRPNPDADAWYDPADGAVYAAGATVDEALEEQQRRHRQDQEAADADIVSIDSKPPAERRVTWLKASEIVI
ncbi:hypothetical protein MOQ72_19865 [Saccharopolyspora sp. K220]|uniref:hypothetical protein n=1 Tax=Saccharopolyspora soli TaxID=2926618 RepID=UPI001F59D8D1|nr:hypothetical protein [Saccharopolyspora soli]MCI2419706.1 hypothetical protein [Saccharopolyspora soli]